MTAVVAQHPIPAVVPLAHKPELFDDDNEHQLVCTVCSRLGKVVEIKGPTRSVQMTIWYTGSSYTGAPSYSAVKACDGNADWLEK